MTRSTTFGGAASRAATLLAGALGGVLFALACQGEAKETKELPAARPAPNPETPAAAAPAPQPGEESAGPAAAPWGALRGAFPLDPAHSFVLFRTTHAGASYTWGRFLKVSGTLKLGEGAADSSVEVKVDAASVFTGVKKRDDHLKGPDFLDVGRFPEITFRSKRIELLDGGRARIRGELTLHGVTREIEVEGRFVGQGKHPMRPGVTLVGFHAEFDIRRTDFGMDKLVGPAGDELRLYVSLEGAQGS